MYQYYRPNTYVSTLYDLMLRRLKCFTFTRKQFVGKDLMLITLIRRELLDNLMTFRFAAAVLIMLLLVVANTSLLALLFAYDTLAGEYERGTLRLVLTHPVSRGRILLAKYISAMVCLLVPLLMSLILAMILLTTSASFSLNTPDFLRIGGIMVASIAYLSVFYLIGMLISVMTRRTSTALMLSMFVWGFWYWCIQT